MPPSTSRSDDGAPVGNREEVASSDQCTAHTNVPPLQLHQQARGKEREVTAAAAEDAEYPPL
eukprot:511168-Pyramimonas_sp.AAC.1